MLARNREKYRIQSWEACPRKLKRTSQFEKEQLTVDYKLRITKDFHYHRTWIFFLKEISPFQNLDHFLFFFWTNSLPENRTLNASWSKIFLKRSRSFIHTYVYIDVNKLHNGPLLLPSYWILGWWREIGTVYSGGSTPGASSLLSPLS